MKRPSCVGLTGGIGSGKSLVANCFAALGIDVIDTDLIARDIAGPGGLAIPLLREGFGADYLTPEGGLDRMRMRELVFQDAEARARLEAILHPAIRKQAAAQLQASTSSYAILVVPLLVESGAYGDLIDRVLVVDCDPEQQLERVVRRDKVPLQQAQAILAAQASREQRLAAADDVIENRVEQRTDHLTHPGKVEAQVRQLHEKYTRLFVGKNGSGLLEKS
jgi:dephospho-CoA kinase